MRSAPTTGTESEQERGPARETTVPAKKGKDPLLAGICHDLRAPLAAVTMGANFVHQTMPDNEGTARSRRVLAAILRSCKQMERLVRDFGDYSEVEGNAVELRVAASDAAELLRIAAESARPEADARGLRLTVDAPASALPLRCDRDRLLRALGHVLDNAVRFSSDGGEIALRVAERDGGGEVRFDVVDRGPGISDETLAHLYDRAWLTKQPTRGGAGLGLAIARGFARAHGGDLEVASAEGGPTRVSLVLPMEPEGEDAHTH